MMSGMARFIVYSPSDDFLFELSPHDVFSAERTEEINGQNSLSLTTSTVLAREQRLLLCDAMGVWREYVISGVDEAHEAAEHAIGTYYCEWSLQHDLQQLPIENRSVGLSGSKALAATALQALLDGTCSKRWKRGTVTVTTSGSASFCQESAWDALSDLVKEWGGEVAAEVAVDSQGVISRKVALFAHRGSTEVLRRFDFGQDLKQIRRKVSEDPLYCRIIPLGKEIEQGGKDQCTTIASTNGGKNYLENTEAAKAFRLADGEGGYDYPTLYVKESSIEDPAELRSWGLDHLDEYTVPKVTYEGSVIHFAEAGMDVKGLALGDETQCVDRCFHEDAALRVSGRVVKLVVDELDPRDAKVTLGCIQEGLPSLINGMMGGLQSSVSGLLESIKDMNGGTLSTADYLNRLIDRLNKEINATGGYTYIKPGEGIWVYDKAEDAYPTQVVRIKGGSISVANTKKANGDWNWQTMITGKDGILASAVTAANITAGYIQSADEKSWWNLDTGEMMLSRSTAVDINATGSFVSYGDTPTRFFDDATKKYLYWWPATICQNGQIHFRGAISASGAVRPDESLYVTGTSNILGASPYGITVTAPKSLDLLVGESSSDKWDTSFSLRANTGAQGSFAAVNATLECDLAMTRVKNLSLQTLESLYVSSGQNSGYGITRSVSYVKNVSEEGRIDSGVMTFVNGICVGS